MPTRDKKRLRDGSGRGIRTNRGRGGCSPPKNRNKRRRR